MKSSNTHLIIEYVFIVIGKQLAEESRPLLSLQSHHLLSSTLNDRIVNETTGAKNSLPLIKCVAYHLLTLYDTSKVLISINT